MEPQQLSHLHRVTLAALACFQNALVGGLIYGWASIDRTLLAAERQHGGAFLSLAETTQIFSWASCVGMFSSLVLGAVLDKFGPRLCSVVSHVFVAAGCQVFSMATTKATFALAACLISFGGPGIQLSIVHLANLFPRNQFLALCCINGTISLNFAVFAIFDIIWTNHPSIGYTELFGAYVVVVVTSLVASMRCWPDKPFHKPDVVNMESTKIAPPTPEALFIDATTEHQHLMEQPLDSYLREGDHSLERKESYLVSRKALATGNLSMVSLKDQPFRAQLFSATYLRILIVFLFSCFLANSYVAFISTELADSQDFEIGAQHGLAQTFTFLMSAGVVTSLLVGWLMDRVGLEFCGVLALILGQIHQIIVILYHANSTMMIVGFVFYVLFRQFLFPVFIASQTSYLGFKFFGLLNGIGFALSGIVQLFMPQLSYMVQGTCHLILESSDVECSKGSWTLLHVVELVVLVILMLSPLMQILENRRRENSSKLYLASRSSNRDYGSLSTVEENFDAREDVSP